MSRQTHDADLDHHGVLRDDMIASGTPADQDVPISNGDGTRTWGPMTGGGGGGYLLEPVFVATTANITISTALNAGDSIDGVSLSNGQRVLVKNQSTPSQNGIYIVGASPARSTDFSTSSNPYGKAVAVFAGSANHETVWLCQAETGDVIGTDDMDFSQITGGGGSISNITDDSATFFPTTGVKFTTGANFVGSAGQTSTSYGQLILRPPGTGVSELYIQSDDDHVSYVDLDPGNSVLIEADRNDTGDNGYVLVNSSSYVDISSVVGSNWAEFIVAGNSGTVEIYSKNDTIIEPDGDVDMSGAGGLLIWPKHASDPTGQEAGAYFNTTTKKFRGYNGTTWQDLN